MRLHTAVRDLDHQERQAIAKTGASPGDFVSLLVDCEPNMQAAQRADGALMLQLIVPIPPHALAFLEKPSSRLVTPDGRPMGRDEGKKAFGPVVPTLRLIVRRKALGTRLRDKIEQPEAFATGKQLAEQLERLVGFAIEESPRDPTDGHQEWLQEGGKPPLEGDTEYVAKITMAHMQFACRVTGTDALEMARDHLAEMVLNTVRRLHEATGAVLAAVKK